MRLLMAGGGNAAQSRRLDEQLAFWIGPAGRLLYLPVALPQQSPMRLSCEAWIRSVFAPLGVTNIQIWYEPQLDAAGAQDDAFGQFDAIYIGGGNTFRLLHALRSRNLARPIAEFARAGGPMYGGSAGAIALGKNISIAELAGDPDDIGGGERAGLGLAEHEILPHYTPRLSGAVAARVSRTGRAVLAIPEAGGWVIDGPRQYDAGPEPVAWFRPDSLAPDRQVIDPE